MTTSNEIKDQIKAALNDAFREQKKIQSELLPKLDTNTKKKFDSFELNKLPEDVSNLINEFDRKGFLDELVIAAIRANSNNPKMVNLRAIMNDINPVVKNHKLSQEFNDLWLKIYPIKRTDIISECLKIFSFLESSLQEKSDLENKLNEVKDMDEIFSFVLKKFLLVEREKLNDGTTTVLFFAQSITKYESKQQDSYSIIDEEFNDILIELDDIIKKLKQDILKIGLENAYKFGFNRIIHAALEHITSKMKRKFFADRVTIYFLNESEKLSSIIADGGESLEIQVRLGEGFAGKVAKDKKAKRSNHIKYDISSETKKQYERTGYPTYNLLTYPLLNSEEDLVAVIQLVNKVKYVDNSAISVVERINECGFTDNDEEMLAKFAQKIRPILEELQDFYKISQKFQEVIRFMQAIQNLSQKCSDLEQTHQMVMTVAKEFMGADRTTLWLTNRQATELWAMFPLKDGSFQEKIVSVGEGYVGKTAKNRQFINIRFDLYNDPDSAKSKEIDRETGYRTCSLMCMPILSFDQELVGVLQLINKIKPGVPIQYDAEKDLANNPPECFQDSFTKEDEKRMQALNNQISATIQKANKSISDKGDDILFKFLNEITGLAKQELRADRVTFFLLDKKKQELWSIIEDEEIGFIEIRLPLSQGIVGEAAKKKKGEFVNVADFYNDPRSRIAKEQEKITGYSTYNILAIPLFNTQNELVAVVEFLNKLKFAKSLLDPSVSLSKKVDDKGFTNIDPKKFEEISHIILKFIEGFNDLYNTIRKQQRESRLEQAIRSVSENNPVPEKIFMMVSTAAQKLVNADRSTLWVLDRKSNKLWAKLPDECDVLRRQEVLVGEGYVGKAAATCEFLNIHFDLYDKPNSEVAKKFDQENGYRTCSLICMPIKNSDGELVGVLQLINKKRQGKFPKYNPSDWPKAPECFKSNFTEEDENLLKAFNSAAGTRLYKIELFDEMQHKAEQIESLLQGRDENPLRSRK